jgi:hypothetical protein
VIDIKKLYLFPDAESENMSVNEGIPNVYKALSGSLEEVVSFWRLKIAIWRALGRSNLFSPEHSIMDR